MKDINNISIDELKKIIYSSNTKTDILKYFGINKLNNIGYKLLKKIENITSINIDELYKTRKYNNISEYYKNPKICKYCGSIIKYDNRKQDFCNKKCSILYLNNKKKKHKQCKLCGKELVNTSNTFCNKECYNKYLQNVKNDKITKWLNGELEVKNSYNTPKFIKEYLFQTYNNKCQLCGWGEKNIYSNTYPLEIHHIDGDCTNNKRDNLLLICPNCHSLTDTNGNLNKNSKRFHKKRKRLK